MTASQERALSLSPASPVVPRQAIRSSQYAESDTEEEEEDIVAIPAKSSGHRRQMSDAPLLPVRDSTKTTELSPRPDFLARAKAFRDRNLGLLLIASAQCWFAGMASAVAVMAQSPQAKVPTWELILTRMAITGICCHIGLRIQGDPHPFLGPPGVRRLLVVRGAVGVRAFRSSCRRKLICALFFGVFGLYSSLSTLPVSDSVCITFLSPLGAGLLSALFLGEQYRLVEAGAGIVALAGVVLIAKPSALFGEQTGKPLLIDGRPVTEHERFIGVCFGLIGCCGASAAYTVLRAIGKRASPLHSIEYFSVICVLYSLMGPILFPQSEKLVIPTSSLFLVLLLLVGIFGFAAQFLLTAGLAREKAGRGSLATFLQMPFAMLFERLIFGRTMDPISLLGAFIIVSSALFTLLSKQKSSTPNSSRRARGASVTLGHGEAYPEVPSVEATPRLPDLESGPSTPIKDRAGPMNVKEDTGATRIPA